MAQGSDVLGGDAVSRRSAEVRWTCGRWSALHENRHAASGAPAHAMLMQLIGPWRVEEAPTSAPKTKTAHFGESGRPASSKSLAAHPEQDRYPRCART